MKYRAVTLYIPTTRYTNKEHIELLQEVKTKVLALCIREGIVPLIGLDVNGAMGVLQTYDGHDKDVSKHIPIGPCVIRQENYRGCLFWGFLEENGLCSLLMWSKLDYGTWRHLRYGWYQHKHISAPRNILCRIHHQSVERYTSDQTDHGFLKVTLRSEVKILPKDVNHIRDQRETDRSKRAAEPPRSDYRAIYSIETLKEGFMRKVKDITINNDDVFDPSCFESLMGVW